MDDRTKHNRLAHWVLLAGILLAACAVRLPALNASSLWADEVISADRAALPLDKLLSRETLNTQAPTYYILLKGWCAVFGGGDAGLRALSVLAGVLCVLVMYVAGRRCAGPAGGLLGALLTAAHPVMVYFSREARAYSLLALVEAASFAMIPAMLVAAPSVGGVLLLGVLQVAALSIHAVIAPVVAIQCGAVFYRCVRTRRFDSLFAYLAVFGVYAWASIQAWMGRTSVLSDQWSQRPYPGLEAAMEVTGYVLGDGAFLAGAIGVAGLVLVGAWLGRGKGLLVPILAATAVAPLLICLVVPTFSNAPLKLRYATPALVPLLLLAALAADPLPAGKRIRAIVAVLGGVAVMGMATGLPALYAAGLHQDWRTLADYVADVYRPGRTVLVVSLKDEGRLLRRYAAGRFRWEGMDDIGFDLPKKPSLDVEGLAAALDGDSVLLVLRDDWFGDGADGAIRSPGVQRARLSSRITLEVYSDDPVSLPEPTGYGSMENLLPHICTR